MEPRIAGWREHVDLLDWNLNGLVAKLDTGARSSCLDARDMDVDADNPGVVRFTLEGPDGPVQREEEILDWRLVRDSGGHQELRPVIAVRVRMGGMEWDDQVTLHDRSAMQHRMLVGRRALTGRVVVDASRTFELDQAASASSI